MDELIENKPETEFFNESEEDLLFKKKVENLETIRIFVNDKIAGDRGRFIVEQLQYLKEMDWEMVEQKPTKDGGGFMKFKPPKRIITEV